MGRGMKRNRGTLQVWSSRAKFQRGPAVQHATPILKCIDHAGPGTALTLNSTAQVTQVIGIGGGTPNGGWPLIGAGIFNRIGNRITLKSLHIVGQVALSANAGAGVNEYLRIMVVYDKMPNGTQPAYADIIADQDNLGVLVSSSWSNSRIDNRDRFKILMDDRVDIPSNSSTSGVISGAQEAVLDYKNECNVNRFIRLNDMETMFKASVNGALGDVAVGNIWIVTVGNVVAGSEGFKFVFNSRIRYTDC